eukprot:gene13778-15220_t
MKTEVLMFAVLACCCYELVLGLSPADCQDEISEIVCQNYSKYCQVSKSLKKLCKRTCGLCPAISPKSCKVKPFGCCWDDLTTAQGPNQQGCPVCKDNHKKCHVVASSKTCKDSSVRRICPASCGLCTSCEDDPEQIDYCPIFKKSGFCETAKGSMKKICRKTCQLCNEKCEYFQPYLKKTK